jgi:Tol biopolymer transport system component
MPGDKSILFASTHHHMDTCPATLPYNPKAKYVWPVYPEFDIFISDTKGKVIKQLTDSMGYDAEATVSPKGDKIVFTSTRTGDLELYTMNIDGSGLKQITFGLGYDGGAFFSPDGKQLVFRASRPKTEEEIKEYKDLLSQGLVAPTNMEIYVIDTNGQNLRQVTHLGKANWAPYFHPSGKKIIFSSNHASPRGYSFQLYMIDVDGTNLTQITNESNFNAFPMFSPNGKKLVWSSNRNNGGTRDTNLFIADWID